MTGDDVMNGGDDERRESVGLAHGLEVGALALIGSLAADELPSPHENLTPIGRILYEHELEAGRADEGRAIPAGAMRVRTRGNDEAPVAGAERPAPGPDPHTATVCEDAPKPAWVAKLERAWAKRAAEEGAARAQEAARQKRAEAEAEEQLVAECARRAFEGVVGPEAAAAWDAEWERWRADPAGEARRAEAEDRERRSVPWAPVPSLYLRFVDEVPVEMTAAWARLDAMPARTLWRWRQKRGACPKRWRGDVETVLAHLRKAEQDARGYSECRAPDERAPVSGVDVLRAVLEAQQLRVATRRRKDDGSGQARTADWRRALKNHVEKTVYRGRCAACGRTREDGVTRYDLDHVPGDGGGVRREVRTDKLRRLIRDYYKEHGEAPWWIEMLCHACHQHQTERRAAGFPWGERVDRETGEMFGMETEEGFEALGREVIARTRPTAAPSLAPGDGCAPVFH